MGSLGRHALSCCARDFAAAAAGDPPFGVLSLGSALALAGVSAWLITRAWQMPPVLDLTVAVVAVRALGISRGVLGLLRTVGLPRHRPARRGADVRERLYARLASGPVDAVMRRHSGELVSVSVPLSTSCPMCWCARWCRFRSPPSSGWPPPSPIAVISPAAAVVLAVCLLVAGGRRAVAGRPGRGGRRTACRTASFTARHRRDAGTRACARAAGQRPTSTTYSPTPTGSNATGAAPSTERRRPLHWRRLRPTAAIGVSVLGAVVCGVALASSVAPTTRRDLDVVAVVGVRGDRRAARPPRCNWPAPASPRAACTRSPNPAASTDGGRRSRRICSTRAPGWP